MTDLRDQLQASLGAAYTLERELGGGGMSRVFVARETALGRSVVVKVLPPEMAAGVSTERFKREISVAARLQHPHIVPLLSAGEMDGIPYFTMPFVAGESLRVRLARRGELPVNEAVRVLREIASGLAYAHENGVVHRDIKPDNVLFAGDVAMVTDFGVAKALSASTNGDQGGMTSLGVALGTPAYMAPEQATADPSIDHRADVYAFGVLAYEMLTGQPPFSGRNPSQLLAAHVTETPEQIARRRPNLPPALAALVMRCLEKRAADRPQSASEIVHALDDITTPSGGMQPTSALAATTPATAAAGPISGASTPVATGRRVPAAALVIGIVVIALGALGVAVWRRGPVAGESGAGPKRLAVLPFENLGDSADAYFADGITDEVRGKLASIPGLQVIASSSTNQYKRTSKSHKDIAKELDVSYLLVGKIRWEKSGSGQSRVRVSPELMELASGGAPTTRWQQPFDAALTDVFQVQADIAGRVAQALNVALGAPAQEHLAERPTQNLAAYDAYLKGVEARAKGAGPITLRQALVHFDQAVALDPSFAVAWAALSDAASLLNAQSTPSPALVGKARSAAERAVALAPDRPEGYVAWGDLTRRADKNFELALEWYTKGQARSASSAGVFRGRALVEQALGHWDAAIEHQRESQRLDPRSSVNAADLAISLSFMRRYAEAHDAVDVARTLAPTNLGIIERKVMLYLSEGNLAAAREVLASVPRSIDLPALVAYVATYYDLYWVLDDSQRALLLRLDPIAFDDDRASWGLALADAYAARGDERNVRVYADSARIALESQLRDAPDDPQLHVLLGTALAFLGRKDEAVRSGERGVALLPIRKDAVTAPYLQHQLARIHIINGEYEKALDQLEPLLKIPYYLSPGWLKIDPTFAPLRGNPRFQRLIAGA